MTIKIYTMDNCGYCEAAKSLLTSRKLNFSEINITGDDQQRQQLIEQTHHRTLPQIFIDNEFIGGYMELKKYFEEHSSSDT